MPFYEHGYNSSGGKLPDPNSSRTERKNRLKGGPPESQPKFNAPRPPTKATGLQVKEFFYPSIIGEKVCVLDGSNLRILRDCLGLCSPGIIPPENRSSKPFWNTIKESLSTICNKSMFKQDELRSSSLVSLLEGNFLEKGANINDLFIKIVRKDSDA